MFWMVTGIPLLPTLPALDWEPMELAEEGIGERGDGVPVLLKGEEENFVTDKIGNLLGMGVLWNNYRWLEV